MMIECPICGHETSTSQYSFDEDCCFNCLQKIDVGDYIQYDEEYKNTEEE